MNSIYSSMKGWGDQVSSKREGPSIIDRSFVFSCHPAQCGQSQTIFFLIKKKKKNYLPQARDSQVMQISDLATLTLRVSFKSETTPFVYFLSVVLDIFPALKVYLFSESKQSPRKEERSRVLMMKLNRKNFTSWQLTIKCLLSKSLVCRSYT